ncbi:bifunctional DNA-formamidopyrimidine glycosylase/DNA-(apurinic or apyrimidinic site) lyase [Microbulbifer sp. OS29]|uniref:Formamidopyrimidine-DNA glycosylase n=1 Tax=Microbulbifer okhotskensis TaxID=2926617 RepID=A0A9X2EJJ2_9GAMM|nr:bifunctional DNA-formamidopyrimidine glycosylase/DNA-(apurinic or apyrimidinic site) lyase [Microbulbifer okhotskensis]MCO1332861.1 bifunctional DNA-formamidopyrimidine glycosylase/DNA-(apurinic or apyrimidinic site) lyase [Microbulbifer okhotskensis]
MPELPEVETTLRGLRPHLEGRKVRAAQVRQHQLRWPVEPGFTRYIRNARILKLERRAKYLLVHTDKGCAIWHLGMSGSLRLVETGVAPEKHDHIDWRLDSGLKLRYRDPRRFGALLWTVADPLAHELLSHLGPEPLSEAFDGDYLFASSRKRKLSVKTFIMDGRIVVGVGNIYASESLFQAGIRPDREAGSISRARYQRLAVAIKQILQQAIAQGGTTLRDFIGGDGKPGYFAQQLSVYGRTGEACPSCGRAVRDMVLGQRNTFFCSSCQR